MLFDQAAIQKAYGASFARLGSTIYRFEPGTGDPVYSLEQVTFKGTPFGVIWDGDGDFLNIQDTIDATAHSTNSYIDLRPGRFSAIGDQPTTDAANVRPRNIAIAYTWDDPATPAVVEEYGLIENAKSGSGNDVLVGNHRANQLEGNIGNDTLDGGTVANAGIGNVATGQGDNAADTLKGGADNDTYLVREGGGSGATVDVVDDTSGKDTLTFFAKNNAPLPFEGWAEKGNNTAGPWTRGRWQYERSGLFNADLIVTDVGITGTQVKLLNFQDGRYNIRLVSFLERTYAALTGVITDVPGAHNLPGTAAAEEIQALDGNDTINAGAGDDLVYGGTGVDFINGEAGNDRLYGEDDIDVIDGGDDNDAIEGGLGDDILDGRAGLDKVAGQAGSDIVTATRVMTNSMVNRSSHWRTHSIWPSWIPALACGATGSMAAPATTSKSQVRPMTNSWAVAAPTS